MHDFPRKAKGTQIQGAIFATVIIANSCRIFRRILRHKIWGNHGSPRGKILCCVARPLLPRFARPAKIRRYFLVFHLDAASARLMLHMRNCVTMTAL
jgi:hypothetical protein